MFLTKYLHHIWKRVGLWALLVSLLANLVFAAAPAMAAGETYTWKADATTGKVDVTDFAGNNDGAGLFTAAVDFKQTSVTAGAATYVGSAQYTCLSDGTSHTDNLTATISAADYNNGTIAYPTRALISGGAACADNFGQTIAIQKPDTNIVNGAPTGAGVDKTTDCDQGSLTWMFCPVIDSISQTVATLAEKILTPLLQVNAISPAGTPQLFLAWSHVRDFANVLFILVFFAIIASTLMQQDIGGLNPYTIKSTWIRLIIAAILVQVSFYISGFIIDIGNVLGVGVSSLLGTVTGNNTSPANLANFLQTNVALSAGAVVGAGALILATWEIAIPVLLGLLITLFVGFLTLGARFLIIAILIVISPLAFVAWVLPNTRHYTSDWSKILMRLVMMYPIIIGVFTLGGIVNQILPFSSDAAGSGVALLATKIIKPIITIAMFLAIPESFRLAGKGLTRINGLLSGAGSKGRGFLKNTEMYKEGQLKQKERRGSLMQSLANSSNITSLTRSDSSLKRAVGKGMLFGAGTAIGASSSPRGIQSNFKSAIAERQKTLKEFDNISPGLIADAVAASYGDTEKMRKITREAPALVEYTKTLAGRTALAGRASEAGTLSQDHIRMIRKSSMSNELSTLQSAIDKNNYPEKPHMHRLTSEGLARPDMGDAAKAMTSNSINNKLDKGFWEAASGEKQTRADGTVFYTPDAYSQSITKEIVPTLTASEIGNFFDSNNTRTFGSREKRAAILTWAATNITELRGNQNGRAVLNAISTNMHVNSHTDNNRNRDLFGDFYSNVLTDPTGLTMDPQNDGLAQQTMGNRIETFLS